MNPYEYKVSLRITHPSIDPQIITGTLGLKPFRSWQEGSLRQTPKGKLLEGKNNKSYWSAQLTNGDSISSEEIPLESYLLEKTNLLKEYSGFLGNIKESGGKIEYFIGIFGNKNLGSEFGTELLTSMNNLGIELSLDVYPDEK
jgi:hypothetical protein